jgi:hypothetical protein
VLVVGSKGPVEGVPRFRGQKTSYVAIYTLSKASLSILGSAAALAVPVTSPLATMARRAAPDGLRFDPSDEGADLNFSRFGAGYTLRLACDQPTADPRCSEERFLRSVADSLIAVGGTPK